MIKKFLEWIGLKEKIHTDSVGPLYYNEGEIWWCAVGQNVGIEINGEGKMFSRPVYIYKKLSKDGFMGISVSTQKKTGSWYVSVICQNKESLINLAQARIFSSSRMYKKIGTLDNVDIKKIKTAFSHLYF